MLPLLSEKVQLRQDLRWNYLTLTRCECIDNFFFKAVPGEITVAVYTFSHEKGEPMPYRVKIPTKSVSLRHVKDFLPKKGAFRYYSRPFV